MTQAQQADLDDLMVTGDAGETIEIGPLENMRVLSGSTGEVRAEVIELTMDPGGGPPLHVHRDHEEAFYILEGTAAARIGDATVELSAGDFLRIPPGRPHAPFNPGSDPVRALIIGSPAGFVEYFREISAVITDWPPTPEMIEAAGPAMARAGVELVGPPPLEQQ